MHLKHLLISTVLFLLPIVHAAGIGEVNGANLALEEEANKDDSNVEALNALNAVTNGKVRPTPTDISAPSRSYIQGIANDLATFTAAVASSMQNGEGTAATNDAGTEQTVVNGFASVNHLFLIRRWCIVIGISVRLTSYRHMQLSDATADYMSDLAAKVNLLTLQKAQISASLKQLLSNYNVCISEIPVPMHGVIDTY